MGKKVGIVTMYGLYNYGNRLQNYAVHRLLKDLGYESETLVCVKSKIWNIAHNMLRIINTLRGKQEYKRRTAFSKFVNRTTPIRYVYAKDLRIPKGIADDYICFFTGSDQVWNPEVRIREKYNYFLQFAPQKKRFSIAPSFGVSSIPEKLVSEYREWIFGINYPSCREAEGADIIKNLTGHEAEVIIDPTMMLSKDKWRDIYEKISVPEKPYLLTYFLGDVKDDRKIILSQIADQYGLQIADCLKDPQYSDLQPDGLLQMIDNATFVCTDSFHITAFSINFNIPFYVFDRQQEGSFGNHMISRIDNLLSIFGLNDRLNPTDATDAMECDFKIANEHIEIERNKELNYLIKCLNMCQHGK